MSDRETLAAYAKAAEKYGKGFAATKNTPQDSDYAAFVAGLRPAAHVLDLGCGPGQWAARLQQDGFTVTAVDASAEMAEYAQSTYGLNVQIAVFEDLAATPTYDGVWANFSLLHAPKSAFPAHLKRVHSALRPKGMLSLGMKLGEGEGRDTLGRFYSYYSEKELRTHLAEAGFTVLRSRCGNGHGLAGAEETFVVLTAHG